MVIEAEEANKCQLTLKHKLASIFTELCILECILRIKHFAILNAIKRVKTAFTLFSIPTFVIDTSSLKNKTLNQFNNNDEFIVESLIISNPKHLWGTSSFIILAKNIFLKLLDHKYLDVCSLAFNLSLLSNNMGVSYPSLSENLNLNSTKKMDVNDIETILKWEINSKKIDA